jgi:hypothetical protein
MLELGGAEETAWWLALLWDAGKFASRASGSSSSGSGSGGTCRLQHKLYIGDSGVLGLDWKGNQTVQCSASSKQQQAELGREGNT